MELNCCSVLFWMLVLEIMIRGIKWVVVTWFFFFRARFWDYGVWRKVMQHYVLLLVFETMVCGIKWFCLQVHF